MAIKQKVKDEDKKSRILEILQTDYKWETYLFIALSIIVTVIGVLLLTGTLTISSQAPVIGSFPKVFSILLVVFGGLGLVYGLFPFAQYAWPELKKVTWPTKKVFIGNTIKVFTFLIIFTLVYLMYDVVISEFLARFLRR
jgi:preprotein translocase subunit SecE